MLYTTTLVVPVKYENQNINYIKSGEVQINPNDPSKINRYIFVINNYCILLYNAIMQIKYKTKLGLELVSINFPLDKHISNLNSKMLLPGDTITIQIDSYLLLSLFHNNLLENLDYDKLPMKETVKNDVEVIKLEPKDHKKIKRTITLVKKE